MTICSARSHAKVPCENHSVNASGQRSCLVWKSSSRFEILSYRHVHPHFILHLFYGMMFFFSYFRINYFRNSSLHAVRGRNTFGVASATGLRKFFDYENFQNYGRLYTHISFTNNSLISEVYNALFKELPLPGPSTCLKYCKMLFWFNF